MIYLLAKEKFTGDGRAFGSEGSPIAYSVVLLSSDGTLPVDYTDVENLIECEFAPGSILIDAANNQNYIYDGTEFKPWG